MNMLSIEPIQFCVLITPFHQGNVTKYSKELFKVGDVVDIHYSDNNELCTTKCITGRIHPDSCKEKLVIDVSEKFQSELIVFSGVKAIREIIKKS